MKSKKYLVGLMLAAAFMALPFSLTACDSLLGTEVSSSQGPSFESVGEYYLSGNTASEPESTLTITDKQVTVKMGAETLTGGYTYDGVKVVATFANGNTAEITVDGTVITLKYDNVTYTYLKKVKYTVTFDSKGGTAVSAKEVYNGQAVAAPANPTKANHVFAGWYLDEAFEVYYDFATPVTENTTLYARFVEVSANQNEFKVNFVVDGVAAGQVTTVNGAIYKAQLPAPTKSNATFAGWWMSSYDDATKLTRKYDEEKLLQDTTLYAVWESAAPAVSVSADKVTWTAEGVNNMYKVTVKDAAGAAVYTQTTALTEVAVPFAAFQAGDYTVDVEVVGTANKTTAYYQSKALPKVCNFSVSADRVLTFNAIEGVDKYVVAVVCGDEGHVHTAVEVTTNAYDFSTCAMAADGIKFTVTAVKDGYVSSVSKTFTFEQTLGAVTNLTIDSATETASWTAVENAENYVVQIIDDGTALQEQTTTETSVSLTGLTGVIEVKVYPVARAYNSSAVVSATWTNDRLATPTNVRLDKQTLVWTAVEGVASYTVKIGDTEFKNITSNQLLLTDEHLASGASSYAVTVKAVAADETKNSLYSAVMTLNTNNEMLDTLSYANGKVSWDYVLGAAKYGITVNDGEEMIVDGDLNTAAVVLTQKGANVIKVRAYDAQTNPSEYVSVTVTAYEIVFNAQDGVAVTSVYKAAGDTYAITESTTKIGYKFEGWYDVVNGKDNGVKQETLTVGEADITVYADWTAMTVTITLDAEGGTVSKTEETVTFDENFTLPVAKHEDPTKAFGGWYQSAGGVGTQYTTADGKSTAVWKGTENVTLHAYWVDSVLNFTELANGEGYAVSKGINASGVTEITIPATYNGKPVTNIESGAFANIGSLKTINIPDTVTLIFIGTEGVNGTGSAFGGCARLENINVYCACADEAAHATNAKASTFVSKDGVLFNNDPTTGLGVYAFPAGRGGKYEMPATIDMFDGTTANVTVVATGALLDANITDLVIPATVQTIYADAFTGALIDNVTFAAAADGNEVGLNIYPDAFNGCKSLTSITLPARLQGFNVNVLSGCTSLTEIDVQGTPAAGSDFAYTASNGLLLSGDGKTLVYVPKGIRGEYTIDVPGLTTIGTGAFVDCNLINKVIIPSYVTTIKTGAFENLTSLVQVEFAEIGNRLSIESKAFHGCGLTNVTLPQRMHQLGAYAFGANVSLTNVVVNGGGSSFEMLAFGSEPDGDIGSKFTVETVTLGEYADDFSIAGVFGSSVRDISVHDNNLNFSDYEGVLLNKAGTEIVFVPDAKTDSFDVPDTVTKIGENTFAGKKVTSVKIPASVTSIGDYAFKNSSLSSITFEGDFTKNGLTIGNEAFYNTSISTITLPEGTTSIGNGAFKWADLRSIHIPSTVSSIATSTTDVVWDGGVPYFDLFTNYDTASSGGNLTTITVASGNKNYVAQDNVLYLAANGVATELLYCARGAAGTVDLLPSITKIWAYAFSLNTGVTEITTSQGFSGKVTVGRSAFEEMKAIEKVTFAAGLQNMSYKMFWNSMTLKQLNVPYTVASVEGMAFGGCNLYAQEGYTGLTYDETPDNVDVVGLRFEDTETSAYAYGGAEFIIPDRTVYIGDSAFNRLYMTEVIIPASVTFIGEAAFECNEALTRVVFNTTNLAEIPSLAFERCWNLKDITLPAEGLKKIGASAFQNVRTTNGTTGLTQITIPASVEVIGDNAFYQATELATVTLAAGSQLKEIGANAFRLTSVNAFTFPATVEVIGDSAFEGTKLATATFAETGSALTKVGSKAFALTKLTEFILPESSKNITLGDSVFNGVTTLKKIHFSSTVQGLGTSLTGCTSYNDITVHADNKAMYKDPTQAIIYNAEKTAFLLIYDDLSGKYDVPEGITSLDAGVFANQTGLTAISFPSTLQTIGEGAFQYCVNLKTVTWSDKGSSLTSIGKNAFKYCAALTAFDVPASVTSIGESAFESCESLATVTMAKNGVSTFTLGKKAFRYCYALSSITLPDALKTLNQYAFENCTSLTTIELPANVSFGTNTYVFQYSGLTKIVLPASVTNIPNYTFNNCYDLAEVVFPSTLTTIGNNAFTNAPIKGTPTTVDGVTTYTLTFPEGLTAIGNNAFKGNTAVTKVVLPNLTKTVGTAMFQDATALESVVIGDGLAKWSNNMFNGCTSLSKVYYSSVVDGETVITEGLVPKAACNTGTIAQVFMNTALTSVVIPKNWTMVGGSMFKGCTLLESVTFADESVCTRIVNNAFENCGTELADGKYFTITLPSTVNRVDSGAFKGSNLKSIALPNLTYSSLGSSMFENCVNLETVTFADGWTKALSASMFKNCTALTGVTLPSGLLGIGTNCFENSGLTSITLPATITSIPNYAFAGCTDLASVTFEKDADGLDVVTAIGNYAFQNCSLATKFEIPSTVKTLGTESLHGTGLTTITLPNALTAIGEGALGAKNLTAIVSSNPQFVVENGGIYRYLTDTVEEEDGTETTVTIKKLLYYYGAGDANNSLDLTGVDEINGGAFYGNTQLKKVILPATMTEIPDNFFKGFVGLESIVIPAGVTAIGDSAFEGCVNLTTVTFESNEKLTAIGASAFEGAEKLATLTVTGVTADINVIPDSVETLGNYAFASTTALKTFKIPSSMTSLGILSSYGSTSSYIFQYSGLTSINIPKKIERIGSGTFHTSQLATITFDDRTNAASVGGYYPLTIDSHVFNNTQLKELILPEGTNYVGMYNRKIKRRILNRRSVSTRLHQTRV